MRAGKTPPWETEEAKSKNYVATRFALQSHAHPEIASPPDTPKLLRRC
jgi:hypothetical protein